MVTRTLIAFGLLLSVCLSGCIVDGLLATQVLDEEFETPPDAPQTTVRGVIDPERAGDLRFFSAAGDAVNPLMSSLDEEGRFEAAFPGTDGFTGLRISSTRGGAVTMGIIPNVPRAFSVGSPPVLIDLSEVLPEMAVLSDSTTASVLILDAKARGLGGLQTLSAAQVIAAVKDLDDAYAEAGPALTLRQMVSAVQIAGAASPGAPAAFVDPSDIAAVGSALNPAFLSVVEVDYDADGRADRSTDAFDAALLEAAATLDIEVCLDPAVVRVVFQVDISETSKDLNCEVIDPFKWVDPDPGDSMYFTGAVHETQPNCADPMPAESCATSAEIKAASTLMGDFAPNRVAMYDDGTNGDAVSGDGIWTVSFVLKRGLRVGYKYTYGQGGQGWTATEEWPGNSRLLEVVDTDDDGFVVRHDYFADETSNKDKQNQLSPARGGRGTIDFTSDQNGDGAIDAQENLIDTDDDCVADAKPSSGSASPVLCEEDGE
jgi:hypothetical protein